MNLPLNVDVKESDNMARKIFFRKGRKKVYLQKMNDFYCLVEDIRKKPNACSGKGRLPFDTREEAIEFLREMGFRKA